MTQGWMYITVETSHLCVKSELLINTSLFIEAVLSLWEEQNKFLRYICQEVISSDIIIMAKIGRMKWCERLNWGFVYNFDDLSSVL